MNDKPITCTKCKASDTHGDPFVGYIDVKIRKNFRATSRGSQGSVMGYWLDEEYPDRMPTTVRLECESCGHSWTTRTRLILSAT